MPDNRSNAPGDGERETRIAELKRQAAQSAGGTMTAWESDTLPDDIREQFWRQVVECETGESTTDFQRLTEAGVALPEPGAIHDEEISAKLSEIFAALADMNVFVSETDHLSDRELYSVLWHRVLREEVSIDEEGGTYLVNLLMTGSEENTRLYLKYYADEQWRRHWQADFPDYQMPAHEDPPYRRDCTLPKPPYPV